MCVIIDANCFSSVFDKTDKKHHEFSDILRWITEGEGKIVYGGEKYKEELRKAYKYIRIFRLLKESKRAVEVCDRKVNAAQKQAESLKAHKDFDDPHLIAIASVSGCKIICTKEKRAIPFLKDPNLYPKGCTPPSLYTSSRNKDLLTAKYIADICKPCTRKKAQLV